MSKTAIFRADASNSIGSGHVMRCLTLASALAESRWAIHFICRELPGNYAWLIKEKGFQLHMLPAPGASEEVTVTKDDPVHAPWLGVSWQRDSDEVKGILSRLDSTPDWMIVDSYAIDYRWQASVRALVGNIMVIDDLDDRNHDCDLFLNQNPGWDESSYDSCMPKHAIKLLGTKFALLRSEFAQARTESMERRKAAGYACNRLLISMGGADPDNITGTILDAIRSSDIHIALDVVLGKTAPHYEAVKSAAMTLPQPVNVIHNANNMADLLSNADLAIGTAGTSSWERACLGLPALLIVAAENQKKIARMLEESGAGKSIGWFEDINYADILANLNTFISDKHAMREMSEKGFRLCDGLGVQRVMEHMQ